jgi:hypothetical protein
MRGIDGIVMDRDPGVPAARRAQLLGQHRPLPDIGSPALPMIQNRHRAQQSSFSRGFSVVPARSGTVLSGSRENPNTVQLNKRTIVSIVLLALLGLTLPKEVAKLPTDCPIICMS